MKYFLLVLSCGLFHMFSGINSENICTEDHWGVKTVFERYSKPVTLPAGSERLGITIPVVKICPVLKGQKVVACDEDVAPSVHILGEDLALVSRKSWAMNGTLHVTYYCDYKQVDVVVTQIRNPMKFI